MATYNLEDYLLYKDSLEQSKDSTKIFFNDSIIHAYMVMTMLVNMASESETKYIQMYCGEFSLFREKTRAKVNEIIKTIEPEDKVSESHKRWRELTSLFDDLQEALKKFFINNGRMDVVQAKGNTDFSADSVKPILEDAEKRRALQFYKLERPVNLKHFFVSGKSYRREMSDEEKTALCSFSAQETASLLSDAFVFLRQKSSKVYLV